MTEDTPDPGGQVFILSTTADGVVGQGTGPPPGGNDDEEEKQP